MICTVYFFFPALLLRTERRVPHPGLRVGTAKGKEERGQVVREGLGYHKRFWTAKALKARSGYPTNVGTTPTDTPLLKP